MRAPSAPFRGKNLYYYPGKFCFPAQTFAAKERKDRKEKIFNLCVLCVLLRPSSGCGVGRAEFIRG